jgi:hypothetical protein
MFSKRPKIPDGEAGGAPGGWSARLKAGLAATG